MFPTNQTHKKGETQLIKTKERKLLVGMHRHTFQGVGSRGYQVRLLPQGNHGWIRTGSEPNI